MAMLLDNAGREKVTAAIVEAESRCAAEIVFSEAPRSADYGGWFALPVLLVTAAMAIALHLMWPQLPTPWLLVAQVPVAVALWCSLAHPRLALLLIPNVVEVQAVRGKALQLFAEHALFETPQRAGVLIYVSTFERRVEILADRGLDGVIDQAVWQQHVSDIVAAIHSRNTAEGVCKVVQQVADRVSNVLGSPHNTRNELPDLI